MRGSLFGDRPVGAVTIVETPVSQWYVRRARIAFLTVTTGAAVVAAVLLAAFIPPLWAVALAVFVGGLSGLLAGALVRAWPVLRVLWWWSLEITIAAIAVTVPSVLSRTVSPGAALTVVLTVPVLCLVVGPVRRFLSAWSWVVVVRHRLRLCFAGIVRGSGGVRPGSLPLVLWAKPTPAGERAWLWLRPGLELLDLDGKTGRIAVACWAKQVRVVAASERYAALIRVDIARRDPLAGRIDSPLALLIPSQRNKNADVPVSPAVPPVGLDLADIPEPAAPEARGGRR
jgi:hypothetical protein